MRSLVLAEVASLNIVDLNLGLNYIDKQDAILVENMIPVLEGIREGHTLEVDRVEVGRKHGVRE